jgi:hypothetical protein
MIEVTDNCLPQEHFQKIQTHLMGSAWPWYFNTVIDGPDDRGDPSKSQFIYGFFDRRDGWINSGQSVIWPLAAKINPIAWLRIKANLNPWQPEQRENSFHVDMEGMRGIPFWTSIYYLNSNNGYTLFEDGTRVESVANRLVTFPGNTRHTGCNCTDQKSRVLINLNYIKTND